MAAFCLQPSATATTTTNHQRLYNGHYSSTSFPGGLAALGDRLLHNFLQGGVLVVDLEALEGRYGGVLVLLQRHARGRHAEARLGPLGLQLPAVLGVRQRAVLLPELQPARRPVAEEDGVYIKGVEIEESRWKNSTRSQSAGRSVGRSVSRH
jgi:hypothetical protein